MRIEHQKLVRDKIPEYIALAGEEAGFRVLSESEFDSALKAKLSEEVAEYLESGEISELADIMAVIRCLARLHHGGLNQVMDSETDKRNDKGEFDYRIFLEWSDDGADNQARGGGA